MSRQALFTVYDGHGKEGDLCALFCRDTLPGVLHQELRDSRNVEEGLKRAFVMTNEEVMLLCVTEPRTACTDLEIW